MKPDRQLEKRIAELEFANERLKIVNETLYKQLDFALSHKHWIYKLFV